MNCIGRSKKLGKVKNLRYDGLNRMRYRVNHQNNEKVTSILADLRDGDRDAAERLLPIIYDELHGIAKRVFNSQRGNETLQPTILVHDVFLKLAQKTDIEWENRAHFFAVAAKATRDLLVDHARRRKDANCDNSARLSKTSV